MFVIKSCFRILRNINSFVYKKNCLIKCFWSNDTQHTDFLFADVKEKLDLWRTISAFILKYVGKELHAKSQKPDVSFSSGV